MQRAAAIPKNPKINYHDHVCIFHYKISRQSLTLAHRLYLCKPGFSSRSNCGRSMWIWKNRLGRLKPQSLFTTKYWNCGLPTPRLSSILPLSWKRTNISKIALRYGQLFSSYMTQCLLIDSLRCMSVVWSSSHSRYHSRFGTSTCPNS